MSHRRGLGLEVARDRVRLALTDADGHVRATAEQAVDGTDQAGVEAAVVTLTGAVPDARSRAVGVAISDAGTRVERAPLDQRGAAGVATLLRLGSASGADLLTVVDDVSSGPCALTVRWDGTWVERVTALVTALGLAPVTVEPSEVSCARAALPDAAAAVALAAAGAVAARPLRPLTAPGGPPDRLVIERRPDDPSPRDPAAPGRWSWSRAWRRRRRPSPAPAGGAGPT